MQSVLWVHFASQWKNEMKESAYSEPYLHGKLALCVNEVGRLGLTQECSVCRIHFFCGEFRLGCFSPFRTNKVTLTDPHCAEPFIALEKINPSEMSLELP